MPTLPLDHPEPLSATLGVMLHPGEGELEQKRARAWAAQYLAEPVRRFREKGEAVTEDVLAQLYADSGMPVDNLKLRWRDGIATGQMFALYFKASHTRPALASWENAVRAVSANARKHSVSASRSLLRDALSRYRPVAHLWGAWCLRGQGIWPNPKVNYQAWDDFQFFLMEAEILLRWGRKWRPDRDKAKPPLSGEAWRVPTGWEPPEYQPGWPRTAVSLAVPDEILVHFRRAGRPRKSA